MLRVGNVLQVVPSTTVDWPGVAPSPVSIERQPTPASYSSSMTSPRPAVLPISVPLPVPVPVPVPMPTLGVNAVATLSPLGLPVPSVVLPPGPIPIARPVATFPRVERATRAPPPPPPPQPVYNYEAILEVRRKEREERKKLREERRREKERRKSERVRRRAKRLLGRNGSAANRLVPEASTTVETEAVQETDEKTCLVIEEPEEIAVVVAIEGEKERKALVPTVNVTSDCEMAPVEPDEEEEEDEDEEGDAEEEDEEEDEEEEPEDGEQTTPEIQNKIDTTLVETEVDDERQIEPESLEPFSLPPPPRKGILVPAGFW